MFFFVFALLGIMLIYATLLLAIADSIRNPPLFWQMPGGTKISGQAH